MLSVEKLRFPSLDANSESVTLNRPWTYTGATGPPVEVGLVLFRRFTTELRIIE